MQGDDPDDQDEIDDNDPLQRLIGDQLRALYDEVLSEPLPERLQSLLARLDEVTADDGRNRE